jgi:undecaprenyl-diphosphatase
MNIPQAIISGLLQGITEFFPVSSSGHLVILHSLWNIERPQVAFDVALHFGTLFSVLIYFWKDILSLFTTEKQTAKLVLIGSIPAFVVGGLAHKGIEGLFAMPKLVGLMLVLTGIWVGYAGLLQLRYEHKHLKRSLGPWKCFAIGIAQAIAIVPGISRSGATIATGVVLGIEERQAFKFSFLLSVPAIAAATLLKLPKAIANFAPHEGVGYLLGGVTATIVGLATLWCFWKLLESSRLYVFGLYCVAIGSMGLFFFF